MPAMHEVDRIRRHIRLGDCLLPVLSVFLLLVLCGCDLAGSDADRRTGRSLTGGDATLTTSPATRKTTFGKRGSTLPVATTIVEPGSDRTIAAIPATGSGHEQIQRSLHKEFELNLVSATIAEAAKVVLGDSLGLTYSIDPAVSGTITLETSTPLDGVALFEAFQASIELNGATITESGGLFTILPTGRATPRFVTPANRRGVGRRIVIVPLRFISTREMLRILQPIVSSDAVLQSNESRNILLVSGNQAEIDTIINAVNIFDIDVLKGKSVALFRLRAASPEAVSQELERIFEVGENGSLEGVVSFIPNERLGSILVVTSRSRYLSEAEKWIKRLDATAGRATRHTVVYALENRSAVELAPTLSEIVSSWSKTAAPGEGEAEAPAAPEGAAKVVADDASNAIVAFATGDEHEELAQLIAELDSTPAQVLIEATIAEVTLNDELQLGVRWFFENGNFSFSFSDLASGGVAPTFPGFSMLFKGGSAMVALNALSSVTDVNIVSTPSVLVIDNREAELRVGDQVPIATRSSVTTTDADAPVVNDISLRDTGVILKIRPRISSAGRIIMDIEQEVSDVIETTTSGIDSPTISQRRLKTSVAVDSGQTLALGGLIEDTTSKVTRKVPVLGDIPILGLAFRDKDDGVERRELLILITPRVIRDGNEAREITDEYRMRVPRPDALLTDGKKTPRHSVQRLLR